jgi:hypothetical protein
MLILNLNLNLTLNRLPNLVRRETDEMIKIMSKIKIKTPASYA